MAHRWEDIKHKSKATPEGLERARRELDAVIKQHMEDEQAVLDRLGGIDPADTRECDGYRGLAPDAPRLAPCQFYDVEGRVVPADLCTCGPMTRGEGYCECGADPDSCPAGYGVTYERGPMGRMFERSCCGDPGDCSGCGS